MEFDNNGYIIPSTKHQISLSEFELIFVRPFLESSSRLEIFQGFLTYLDEFQDLLGKEAIHWVGGSFTTQKLNPRDIDMVSFIPLAVFHKNEIAISRRLKINRIKSLKVDGYILPIYPKGHRSYPLYQGNLLYWENQFSKTRKNRAGRAFKRGFVELLLDK